MRLILCHTYDFLLLYDNVIEIFVAEVFLMKFADQC